MLQDVCFFRTLQEGGPPHAQRAVACRPSELPPAPPQPSVHTISVQSQKAMSLEPLPMSAPLLPAVSSGHHGLDTSPYGELLVHPLNSLPPMVKGNMHLPFIFSPLASQGTMT